MKRLQEVDAITTEYDCYCVADNRPSMSPPKTTTTVVVVAHVLQ